MTESRKLTVSSADALARIQADQLAALHLFNRVDTAERTARSWMKEAGEISAEDLQRILDTLLRVLSNSLQEYDDATG